MPPVYGVMGEDDSDVESVSAFVKRLRQLAGKDPPKVKIHCTGYKGCAEMLRMGAVQLSIWAQAGVTRAVVCYDADRSDPADRLAELEKMVAKSGITIACGLIVPVQELEAWLLADVVKLHNVFGLLRKKKPKLKAIKSPESINDPKEHLVRLSHHPERHEALYHPPTHNVVMAEKVDLALVKRKCPSFGKLVAFVDNE